MDGGKQPGPDQPISIELVSERVIVRIGNAVIADSSNALVLQEANYAPVFYIPREDVLMTELTLSSTSTHCPYKGNACYFTTRRDRATDIAWSYEDPFDATARIKGYVAFYANRVDEIELISRSL